MRKLIITLSLVAAFFSAHSQNVIAQNENVSPLNIKPTTFEDYLVQLAWTNSPETEGGKYDIEARKQEIELAKKDWMRNLSAGLNFNDVSFPYFVRYGLGVREIGGKAIDTTRFSRIATYPLWQINVGVNFGDLLNRKHKVKFAENRRKISETELNLVKQKLKAEVLKRYQEYLVSIEILKVRVQSLDAAEANKVQISSLFAVNKSTFQDYNEANKTFVDALETKLKSESDVKIRRIAMEELLGVKWENVEKMKATYDVQKK